MHELIQESEVEKAVQTIFADYNRGKHIDNIDIYNRPDQAEIQTILQNLIRVVYPGHFRDRSHKFTTRRIASRSLSKILFTTSTSRWPSRLIIASSVVP